MVVRCRAPILAVLVLGLCAPAQARPRDSPSVAPAASATRFATPAAEVPRPPLPAARTVRGALRRALLAGHLTQAEHDALRRRWRDAERLAGRLGGRRGAELRGALAGVADLAARGRLTPGRLPLAFLTVRRNAWAWSSLPVPAAKDRITFGRDPLIWQHYPGRGWQLQPLASAGRANALARVCLDAAARAAEARTQRVAFTLAAGRRERATPLRAVRERGPRCRPAALGRLVDRLVAVGARRSTFLAWEAPFAFGGARPGWISGMTQATVVQALVRAASALGRPELRRHARLALGAFERRPPVGVAQPAAGGRFYVLYSDLPHLRVVNGHLQALIGLREAAARGLGRRAGRAFRRGQGAARPAVRAADTGAWSLYSTGGRESDLGYHRLVGGFLRELCSSTRRPVYCAAGTRFARYEREAPRIGLSDPRGVRVGRLATVQVRLSKVSTVRVTVAGRKAVALDRRLRLPRGRHAFAFRVPKRGAYRVRVVAQGLSGPRAATAQDFLARPPKRPKRRRAADL